ncbi:hypothetical protein ACFSQP_03385 [Bizionia sediminis]|uniref:Uncharacterized protein n=1 Tax=Bizionia sediminis TaxID=1737064 RepID=A0ABW5KQX0_9FLAO
MIAQNLALYNWTNGVIMIAIFALVCITLVGFLIKFMMSGKPKEESQDQDNTTTTL